jgi:hypothetical protein
VGNSGVAVGVAVGWDVLVGLGVSVGNGEAVTWATEIVSEGRGSGVEVGSAQLPRTNSKPPSTIRMANAWTKVHILRRCATSSEQRQIMTDTPS